VLTNGQILVTGGSSSGNFLSSAELYDLSTGVWTMTGSMTYIRSSHMASVLTNGQIIATGGINYSGSFLNSVDLYNPSTGVWALTGSMHYSRYWHKASVLTNGKILVTGGVDSIGIGILNRAELYQP